MTAEEENRIIETESSGDGDENDDKKPLLPPTFKAYKRRIYILLVYSMFCLLQDATWNTWGPISDTASKVYGWDNTTLALLPNWGPICFVLAFIPMVNILLKFGLRVAAVHCSFLMALGTGLRIIPANNLWKTILSHICGIFVGYCGTLGMIAIPSLSANWFLPNERTKATAFITTVGQNLATGVSFILPKLMVKDYNVTDENRTMEGRDLNDMRRGLEHFLYLEFGLCLALFLMILVYFPSKPPTPPSSSATVERIEFKAGFLQVIKSWSFVTILIAYALPFGLQNAFVSVLDELLVPVGISQSSSDWVGLFSSLVGFPGGLIFSTITDLNKKLMKPLMITGILISAIAYAFLALICLQVIPAKIEYVYITSVTAGFFCNAVTPLIYEFACEISYPVSKIVTTGILTASNNFFGFILLGLLMIKQLGTTWVAISLSASFLIIIPFLIPLSTDYRRTGVDTHQKEMPEDETAAINA